MGQKNEKKIGEENFPDTVFLTTTGTGTNKNVMKGKPEVHLAAALPDDPEYEGVGDGRLDVQALVVQRLQFL